MRGERTNPKPLASVLESISFLPDIFMLFHFPLFSVLLPGYRSPKLSVGGWLQCFARRSLCLCQPTITFPAEMTKSFFFFLSVLFRYLFLPCIPLLKMYTAGCQANIMNSYRCTVLPKSCDNTIFPSYFFSLESFLLLMLVQFVNPHPC